MARKQSDETNYEDMEPAVAPVVTESASPPVPSGPVPGTVYVENLIATPFGTTLLDGTHLSAGPKAGGQNRSRAIPKKLLPPHVRRLEKAGVIKIVDAAAGR